MRKALAAATAAAMFIAVVVGFSPAAHAEEHLLATDLDGAHVVPPSGATYEGGIALINFSDLAVSLCVDAEMATRDFTDADPVVGVHVHRGAEGVNGPVVVDFGPNELALMGCVTDERAILGPIVAGLLADPGGYYLDVHTADHPDGAIRGQLVPEPSINPSSTTTTTTLPTCSPNYAGLCIPPGLTDGQVNCEAGPDVVFVVTEEVQVVADDVYGLDADRDGLGCERVARALPVSAAPRLTG